MMFNEFVDFSTCKGNIFFAYMHHFFPALTPFNGRVLQKVDISSYICTEIRKEHVHDTSYFQS